MSAIKKLAGQTAIYGLSSIIGRVLNYFLVPLHTAFFATDQYGVISEFYAYVAFFAVFLTLGLETTFFRFVNKSEDKEKTFNQTFSLVLILNGVFLLSVIVFAQSIANWMLFPEYSNYVIWFACILALDATTSIVMAKLRFQEEAKRFAMIQLVSVGVNIALNLIFLLVLFDDYPGAGIGFIFLANLLSSAIRPFFLARELSRFRFVLDKAVAGAMLLFAAPLAIAGFAGIINETLDRILLKRMLLDEGQTYAESQVGIYSANYKLSILITLFIQAFRYAAEPFFFSQAKNQDRDKTYSKIMTWFVIVVMLMFLVISLNLDIFKWFMTSEEFHVGLTVVPILLLANCCLGIYYNQSIWYKLVDRTMFGAYIAIGGAAITVALNVALIPTLGFEGSAWATLICYASMMVASYILGKIYHPIRYNLRKVALYAFSAIGLFFFGKWLTFDSFAVTFALHSVVILVFIALVFFMEKPLRQFKRNKSSET